MCKDCTTYCNMNCSNNCGKSCLGTCTRSFATSCTGYSGTSSKITIADLFDFPPSGHSIGVDDR